VHYAGDAVKDVGALWQAKKDTGQAPPHPDWICLAADDQDGITPTIRGTYDPAGIYARLDIVGLNSSSFIARKDHPGACPGEDRQVIVSAGKQGRPGPPGAKGERGEPGSKGGPGVPAPTILAWKVDRESYTITPIMSDASEVPAIEMPALFEQFHHSEADRGRSDPGVEQCRTVRNSWFPFGLWRVFARLACRKNKRSTLSSRQLVQQHLRLL
jgi:hypothetical protein